MQASLTSSSRIRNLFLGSFISVLALWFIANALDEQINVYYLAIGLMSLCISVGGMISTYRFLITVTDNYFEITQVFTRRMLFSKVDAIELYRRGLVLRSGIWRITVHRGVTNRQELITTVVGKIRHRPDIRVEGHEDAIAEHWGPRGDKTP